MGVDGMGWDGMDGRDGMGWNGMGWDGAGRDGNEQSLMKGRTLRRNRHLSIRPGREFEFESLKHLTQGVSSGQAFQ